MDFAIPVLWIHLAAIVTWVGLWFNTLFVFNSVRQYIDEAAKVKFIETYRKRYLMITWAAIAVFIITGTILMETNENYPGLGHFFASSWATLVFIKHVVVILMLIISLTLLYGTLPKLKDAIAAKDKGLEARLMSRERLAQISLAVLGLAVILIIVMAAELQAPEETTAWLSLVSIF